MRRRGDSMRKRTRLAKDIIDLMLNVLPDLNENIFYRYIKHFVEDKDINKTQLRCLLYLNNYGVDNMSTLCSKLNVEKGSITSLVDDLTKKGYVLRQRDEVDKRRYSLIITDPGKELTEKFQVEYTGYLINKLERLTAKQDREIQDAIKKLRLLLK